MKTHPHWRSASFHPRILLSLFFGLSGVVLAIFALTISSSAPALAQKTSGESAGQPDVLPMIGPFSQDLDLRDLPQIPANHEEEERRLTRYPRIQGTDAQDPVRAVRRPAELAAIP